MADADLAAALKQAKSKPMFFAFIQKGPDGKLIVARSKIASKQIADAKKEMGGGSPVTGKCFGAADGSMVFQVAKAAPALGAALKKVAQRDAGIAIKPDVQVAADADSEEDGAAPATAGAAGGAQKSAPPAAAPSAPAPPAPAPPFGSPAKDPAAPAAAAPAAPKAGAGNGKVTGFQKALQKLGYDPGKIDGIMGPHTEAAIKKFQQASGLKADGIVGPKTQAALAKALQGGAAAAGGAAATGAQKQIPAPASDAASAGAQKQVPAAAGGAPAAPGLQDVAAPALDGAAKDPATLDLSVWLTARQKAVTDLKALAAKIAGTKHRDAAPVIKEISALITQLPTKITPKDITKLEAFIRDDDAITAAEEAPKAFHHVNIRKPLLDALAALK
jgi:hypothetical protein